MKKFFYKKEAPPERRTITIERIDDPVRLSDVCGSSEPARLSDIWDSSERARLSDVWDSSFVSLCLVQK